ncbi:MAG: DegT/DnrJ/EryC1/StrS family aminotransferase [Deltaproteobacteria bacterium]|nr:DegT/DnrJ/EryC1/StrS family aminotransferase [Deltaproteobacteria bacterium]
MKIEFLDLSADYSAIRDEALRCVIRVCDSQRYILSENVALLEKEFSAYTDSAYAVGVASGTDALLLALMALGIGRGDKVITTAYTFFSTASSIARLGALPVFADIDPGTYNIDPEVVRKILRRKKGVKALLPVHLYGLCADMGEIMKLSSDYGLPIIEDAAQSIGAEWNGKKVGSIGDIGCFSFYPSKNLGSFGDGGMVITQNKKTAEMVKMLRVHGSHDRYFHKSIGINSRLDEIQAAVLRVKLKRLEGWTLKRIEKARVYDRLFEENGLGEIAKTPLVPCGSIHVYNQYVIRVKKRDPLKEYLAGKGIGTAIYYPLALHLQECFKYLGYRRGDMPESEKASKETLALPIYPELGYSAQQYVVSCIRGFFSKGGR